MDIDIDLPTKFDPLDYFPQVVRASMVDKGELKKHPAGVYFQHMAKDKVTNLAAIPYDQAEELGYFKFDFLHLSVLDYFENKDEIRALLKIEPDWNILQDEEQVQKLFQVHRHYNILKQTNPHSVQELADTIALIRPGKRHLLNAYNKNKHLVRTELYRREADGQYYFKKGHAISYALTIVLQLHLIKGGIL